MRFALRPALLVALLVPSSCSAALGQEQETAPAPKKAERITHAQARELIRLSGAVSSGEDLLNRMLGSFQQQGVLTPELAKKFRKELDVKSLSRKVESVFVEEVRPPALEAALEFYRSDVGKRWVAAQKAVEASVFAEGERMGQQMFAKMRSGQEISPPPPRREHEAGSLEAKLWAALEGLRMDDLNEIALRASMEPLRALPNVPGDVVERILAGGAVELTLRSLHRLVRPHVDAELVDGVLAWTAKKEAQDYLASLLRVVPKASRIGAEAAQRAAARAFGGR